jgi:hypothetical protein
MTRSLTGEVLVRVPVQVALQLIDPRLEYLDVLKQLPQSESGTGCRVASQRG